MTEAAGNQSHAAGQRMAVRQGQMAMHARGIHQGRSRFGSISSGHQHMAQHANVRRIQTARLLMTTP
jgi:hypothetical protein